MQKLRIIKEDVGVLDEIFGNDIFLIDRVPLEF